MGLKLCIIAWIAVVSLSAPDYSLQGLAVCVFDGDTILLQHGARVRYLGIDAPEIRHDGRKSDFLAHAARRYNRTLVLDRRIRLEFDVQKRDSYQRLLAYVYTANGEMVNALLLEKGFAHVLAHPPNLRHFSLLLSCQRRAMTEGRGIWRDRTQRLESYYIGNKRSFRFHRPACPMGQKTAPHNVRRFVKRRAAFWDGFSPCKRCLP